MMRVLLVGDIHLADRPPSSCTESYVDDLFALLDQTVHLAAFHGVTAVVWAGDVFHHKAPSRTSHKLVLRTVNLIQRYPCRLLIVPGNHDMANDRFDSLAESQPLGVLFEAGAELLSGWDYELPVYGVPWQQEWTTEAVWAALAGWRDSERHRHLDRDRALVVTHAPLYPPGSENPFEFFPAPEWEAAMAGAGCCYYGHVHDLHGTWNLGGQDAGVTFCNQGGLTRGSIHESELTRPVAVTLWDADLGFRRLAVVHRPAREVFRLAEIAQERQAVDRVRRFLDQVQAVALASTSVESVLAHVRTLDLDPGLERLVVELLESA